MPNEPYRAPRPVLIIDGVVSEAMTLDLLCRSLGVDTICATSAGEAASLLGRVRPSAIITHLVMPGADGLDCLHMIAQNAATVPVMVITGSEKLLLKAASELGKQYGLSDLVCAPKPVDVSALRAFICHAGFPCKPSQWDLH
jgi:CheY-like chemotaxis protein